MQILSVTDREYADYLASPKRITWMKHTNMVSALSLECSEWRRQDRPTMDFTWIEELHALMLKHPRVKTNGVPGSGLYLIAELDREDMFRLNRIHRMIHASD